MRYFLFALLVATVASTQLASAAATIPDYRARVNTGLANNDTDPRNANAQVVPGKAKPSVRFYETPARR